MTATTNLGLVTGATPTILGSFFEGNGELPQSGGLTQVGSTFYGMTAFGGDNGEGTLYSLPVTGMLQTTPAPFAPPLLVVP